MEVVAMFKFDHVYKPPTKKGRGKISTHNVYCSGVGLQITDAGKAESSTKTPAGLSNQVNRIQCTRATHVLVLLPLLLFLLCHLLLLPIFTCISLELIGFQ